jgi:tripeptidyl-peptidase-1
MHIQYLLAVAICTALTSASPAILSHHVLHERRAQSPKHWEKISRLSPDIVLPMRVGLTQSNLDQGHEMLMDV